MHTIKNWYVVQTKPCQEKSVAFHLAQNGIATFLPKTETYCYKGLRKHKKTKPLFPSYIFARCERKKIYMVCWTRGVRKVLWGNTQPQPVSDELVHSIKSLANKDGLVRPKRYKKNDAVTITSGPFRDMLALFDRWDSDKDRVCLLLKAIHVQVKVSVPVSLVESA